MYTIPTFKPKTINGISTMINGPVQNFDKRYEDDF